MQCILLTGNVPGKAASKMDTCWLIGAANFVPAPENSLDLDAIWA